MNGPRAAFWHLYNTKVMVMSAVAPRKTPIYWSENFSNDAKSRHFSAGHGARLSVIEEPPTAAAAALASRSGFSMKIPWAPLPRTQPNDSW